MGGRDKNFEDPMKSDQDIRKTRSERRRFSKTHPLTASDPKSELLLIVATLQLTIKEGKIPYFPFQKRFVTKYGIQDPCMYLRTHQALYRVP